MSYEIPPTPKPLAGTYSPALRYSPSPRSSTATDLDLRPSQPPSRAEDNEYYIAFPPSGLPVHCTYNVTNQIIHNFFPSNNIEIL